MEAQVQIGTIEMNELNMQEDRSTTPTQATTSSPLPAPNTPGQARRLRVQEAGSWQPGMPVRFG